MLNLEPEQDPGMFLLLLKHFKVLIAQKKIKL